MTQMSCIYKMYINKLIYLFYTATSRKDWMATGNRSVTAGETADRWERPPGVKRVSSPNHSFRKKTPISKLQVQIRRNTPKVFREGG
jgi:hypothetical protein